jgi:hypothetical protein
METTITFHAVDHKSFTTHVAEYDLVRTVCLADFSSETIKQLFPYGGAMLRVAGRNLFVEFLPNGGMACTPAGIEIEAWNTWVDITARK